MTFNTKLLVSTVSAALMFFAAAPVQAQNFYAGKTVNLVIASTAGGGYDTNGRLVARHIGRFIPGTPTVIVVNMPGASGVKAVNYLYQIAPKDGTAFATFNSAMPYLERIGSPGVAFKSAELSWIGNLSQSVQAVTMWSASGIKTLEDATKKEVIMGALGEAGTMVQFPLLLNSVFGTKFKVIRGYEGGASVDLAMERGEVQGRGAGAWYTWNNTHPEWVRDGKVVALVQIGPRKHPDIPNVPLLIDLAKTEEQRQMFQLLSGNIVLERPFAAPPKIPTDRLEMLRTAFEKMVKDPQFLADAAKMDTDLDPNTGAQTEKIVADIIATPQPVVDKLKAAIGE
jgi:tripartite-type tricarboxylate transporter receptor subunit TctC